MVTSHPGRLGDEGSPFPALRRGRRPAEPGRAAQGPNPAEARCRRTGDAGCDEPVAGHLDLVTLERSLDGQRDIGQGLAPDRYEPAARWRVTRSGPYISAVTMSSQRPSGKLWPARTCRRRCTPTLARQPARHGLRRGSHRLVRHAPLGHHALRRPQDLLRSGSRGRTSGAVTSATVPPCAFPEPHVPASR
jgi:hypothetical protein